VDWSGVALSKRGPQESHRATDAPEALLGGEIMADASARAPRWHRRRGATGRAAAEERERESERERSDSEGENRLAAGNDRVATTKEKPTRRRERTGRRWTLLGLLLLPPAFTGVLSLGLGVLGVTSRGVWVCPKGPQPEPEPERRSPRLPSSSQALICGLSGHCGHPPAVVAPRTSNTCYVRSVWQADFGVLWVV
jgi:hypothetical protein